MPCGRGEAVENVICDELETEKYLVTEMGENMSVLPAEVQSLAAHGKMLQERWRKRKQVCKLNTEDSGLKESESKTQLSPEVLACLKSNVYCGF